MNLKSKLGYRVTAVVKIVSDTQAIFSDECSPTHKGALSIITATTQQDLWNAIRSRALELASNTRFQCVVALIDEHDNLLIRKAESKPVETQPL